MSLQNGIEKTKWNIAQDLLERGSNIWVRMGNTKTDAKKVGFVDSMRGSKSVQLQKAQVCGSIIVASIDPQSLQVQLSISGFVACKDVYDGTEEFNGGGKVSLASFNPKSEDFQAKNVVTKFPYIDFYDDKHKTILAAFYDAIASSYSVSVQGGSYVKCDIQMEAIDMSDGMAYQTQTTTPTA